MSIQYIINAILAPRARRAHKLLKLTDSQAVNRRFAVAYCVSGQLVESAVMDSAPNAQTKAPAQWQGLLFRYFLVWILRSAEFICGFINSYVHVFNNR